MPKKIVQSTDIHLVQIPTPAGPVTVPLPSPFALNLYLYVNQSKTRMAKRAIPLSAIQHK